MNYNNNYKNLKKIILKTNVLQYSHRRLISILGIETSCDDTGVAIVSDNGKVISQTLYSQQKIHLRYGGIVPPRAQDLHRQNIEKAVEECLNQAKMDLSEIHAIAVTNRPGLPMSLLIGLRYSKHLARHFSKPIVPIHHMEAHALCARLEHRVEFPYLCLLVSGGHSQLVLVKNPTAFFLLGESLDDAAGEAFDKVSRKLRLNLLPQYANMSGGQAIETAAKECENSERFEFPLPLARNRDCSFSFAGLKNNAFRALRKEEIENDVKPDEVIPSYKDFCAGFLKGITRHLSNRTQRAIEFCIRKGLLENSNRSLVISGGVACNDYIFESLRNMAETYQFNTFRPSKQFCNDNGVMIAWNGIEKIKHENELCLRYDYESLDILGKCSLGENILKQVVDENITCKWIQLKSI